MSDSLWPNRLQHARLPCPSLSPRVCSYSCPLSQWYHPTILSSVAPFTPCPQSFPASGSFPMSQLFASGGQSIRASMSALPVNIQGWFPLGLTGLISLQSKGLSSLLQHQFFDVQPSLWSSSHILSCLDLSKLSFQGASVLISWLQSTLAVILEPKKTESVTASTFPLLFVRKWRDWMPWS